MERNEIKHSAHWTWRCQYHIVFAPKFRRKVIYGQLKADIGRILKNKKAIEEHIRNQLIEDEMTDQMTMKEYMDPFTGSKNSKA